MVFRGIFQGVLRFAVWRVVAYRFRRSAVAVAVALCVSWLYRLKIGEISHAVAVAVLFIDKRKNRRFYGRFWRCAVGTLSAEKKSGQAFARPASVSVSFLNVR